MGLGQLAAKKKKGTKGVGGLIDKWAAVRKNMVRQFLSVQQCYLIALTVLMIAGDYFYRLQHPAGVCCESCQRFITAQQLIAESRD